MTTKQNQNIIKVDVAKHRTGTVGTVQLAFEKENGRFFGGLISIR